MLMEGRPLASKPKQETKAIANEKYGSYVSYGTDDLLSEISGAEEEDDDDSNKGHAAAKPSAANLQ